MPMQSSKLHFSAEEAALMQNAAWILMKNGIIDKVCHLMGQLHKALSSLPLTHQFAFPENCLLKGPKISRGERYLNLPYVIMDYPRLFSHQSVFAYRVLFWWGHFFSFTWHISGRAKEQYTPFLQKHLPALLQQEGKLICVNKEEWSHHLGEDNYQPGNRFDPLLLEKMILEKPFFKMCTPLALTQPENLIEQGIGCYQELLTCLLSSS